MLRLILRSAVNQNASVTSAYCLCTKGGESSSSSSSSKNKRMEEIIKEKTPKGKLDDVDDGSEKHRDAEKEPLARWPGGVNPNTGEVGGPAGPEPTRYGDWERKGRVTDF